MENYSATLLEDVRHERSLIMLLSLRDQDKMKQTEFTDHEINILKIFLDKDHRRKISKEYVALQLD